MKCLKHEQEYTTYEWCVYCGQPQAAALIKPKLSIGDKYEDGIIVSITNTAVLICKPQDEPNEMSWDEAMKLNDGWILPTKDELNLMYINKDKIGGFSSACYWSSSEYVSNDAWGQNFDNGYQGNGGKSGAYRVRCVRSLII